MAKDFTYLYSFPFIFSALCIFVVSQYTLTRHKARGAWYLFFACLAASFWSLSEGMLYLDLNHGSKILLTKCQYFGITPIPPLTLLFVLTVFGIRSRLIGFLRWLFLAIIPLIIILVWTNPLHKLVFTGYYQIDTGAAEMLGLHHGLLWWLIVAYHYFLVALVTVILLKVAYTASGFGRAQAGVILAAVASVWIANGIYISGYSPVPNMDISPIALTLVAGSMAWGFFRHNLLDILPFAKTEVFKGMDDAIFVFDERIRIVNYNTAAEAIIRTEVSEDIAKQTQQVFKKFPVLQRIIENMRHSEVPIRVDGQKNIYDVRVSKLLGRDGNTIGRIMALRDITARKRAIEAILESEEKFKFLAENMADIVWTLDMDYKVTYVSPSITKVLGFTPEERKRQKIEEMVTPESLERIMTMSLEEFQRDERQDTDPDRAITIEVEYYHKNGATMWMENSVKAIRDKSGSIIGMYGVSRDISARKKAEMVIERFFEQPMNIHIIAGFDGIIHKVNRGWQTILGYAGNEVEGTNFFDLVHSEDRASTAREMEKLEKGETTFYFENRYRHKNGSYRVLAWSATASLEDKLVYAVASDITERKRAEEELISYRDHLEDMVKERTNELSIANKKAEAL